MRPRHSRFNRIYRRITRGSTRHQWKQISQLRPAGSPGHPVPAMRTRAHVSTERIVEADFIVPAEEFSFEPGGIQYAPDDGLFARRSSQSEGGMAIALLMIALFLLACAYAAFSGYMHAHDEKFAWLGLSGALGSLVAAGVGICLAATPAHRHATGCFRAARRSPTPTTPPRRSTGFCSSKASVPACTSSATWPAT